MHGAVFGFDAVLAEQGTKALDLIAELAELLGQGRQVRVRGHPLLLAGGLLGKQFPFPVAQRRGLLILRPQGSPAESSRSGRGGKPQRRFGQQARGLEVVLTLIPS
jgi:hypothetical protein